MGCQELNSPCQCVPFIFTKNLTNHYFTKCKLTPLVWQNDPQFVLRFFPMYYHSTPEYTTRLRKYKLNLVTDGANYTERSAPLDAEGSPISRTVKIGFPPKSKETAGISPHHRGQGEHGYSPASTSNKVAKKHKPSSGCFGPESKLISRRLPSLPKQSVAFLDPEHSSSSSGSNKPTVVQKKQTCSHCFADHHKITQCNLYQNFNMPIEADDNHRRAPGAYVA